MFLCGVDVEKNIARQRSAQADISGVEDSRSLVKLVAFRYCCLFCLLCWVYGVRTGVYQVDSRRKGVLASFAWNFTSTCVCLVLHESVYDWFCCYFKVNVTQALLVPMEHRAALSDAHDWCDPRWMGVSVQYSVQNPRILASLTVRSSWKNHLSSDRKSLRHVVVFWNGSILTEGPRSYCRQKLKSLFKIIALLWYCLLIFEGLTLKNYSGAESSCTELLMIVIKAKEDELRDVMEAVLL